MSPTDHIEAHDVRQREIEETDVERARREGFDGSPHRVDLMELVNVVMTDRSRGKAQASLCD